MAFNNWPYTNFQDLNLGWILSTYKSALNKALEALGKANAVEAEVGTYTDQINAATLTANQASATANQAMNIARNANEVLFISADAEDKAVNYVTWSQGGTGYVTAADIYSAIVTDHKVPVFMDRSQYIYEMAGYETDPTSPLTITRFKFQKDGGNRQDILWIDSTGSITYTTVYRGAGTFVVNITNSQSTGSITSDKTYSEISSAYNSGMTVQCHVVDEVRNLEYYAYDCFFTENSETGDYFGWVSPYDYSNTRFYRAFVREDNLAGISVLPISGGASIQDIIDTVNGGDTNALLYTAQTLSAAQKAQVKQNLGITKEYVTPEMFGAVGDGIADDSVAFQNAVDAAGENKTLFLNGVYKITRTIELSVLPLRMIGGKIVFSVANGQAAFHGTHNVGNTYPTSLYIYNVEIEAPGALVFDLEVYNSKLVSCKVHRAETVFNHINGTTHIIGCRFGAIRNAFIDVTQNTSHGFADSTITDCYINGNENYDNVSIIKGVIDYDNIFSNCFFDYFKYICSQGRACEFNNCVFNRCYSFYPYDDVTATYVYPITASFNECLFEFNTRSYLENLGWAQNITEYLGFIVIKKGYIGHLRVIDPREIDVGYNTLYMVDTSAEKIQMVSRDISRVIVQNVLYKNVLFSRNDLHYFCYKEIPSVVHSISNTLVWEDGTRRLMDCFDGAIVVHPSGVVELCVGYDTTNNTPIGTQISNT